MAYLIQRYFVVVGEPRKPFPAVGQPFGGRALHAAAINMLTTKSPDHTAVRIPSDQRRWFTIW